MGERYRDVIIRSASDGRPGRPPQRSDRAKCAGGKGGVYVRPKRLTPALPAHVQANRINLDAMLVFGGRLTAAVFDDLQAEAVDLLQVKAMSFEVGR